MAAAAAPKRPVQRRIAILGFRGVGKSSLTKRVIGADFPQEYQPTIISTYTRDLQVESVLFHLDIVDTAGQDEYTQIPKEAAIGVHGYVLVYDSSFRDSFIQIKNIRESLLEQLGTSTVPMVLVANKADIQPPRVTTEQGQALAKEWGTPFIVSSAKLDSNVTQVFERLIREMEANSGLLDAPAPAPAPSPCNIV